MLHSHARRIRNGRAQFSRVERSRNATTSFPSISRDRLVDQFSNPLARTSVGRSVGRVAFDGGGDGGRGGRGNE